jgi:hypothetical protein
MMPEPSGKYALVPPGWPAQTWGAHLARIEFLEALGGQHYSRTDPAWNVRKFKDRLLKDERVRIIKLLRGLKVSTVDIERRING